MARFTLPKLFRSMLFKSRHLGRTSRMPSLFLESIEERITPATLPDPTIITPTASTASIALPRQNPSAANNNTTIDYTNPQVVANPAIPADQVMAATSITNQTTLGVVAEYSTNNGASFTKLPSVAAAATLPLDPPRQGKPTSTPRTYRSRSAAAARCTSSTSPRTPPTPAGRWYSKRKRRSARRHRPGHPLPVGRGGPRLQPHDRRRQ